MGLSFKTEEKSIFKILDVRELKTTKIETSFFCPCGTSIIFNIFYELHLHSGLFNLLNYIVLHYSALEFYYNFQHDFPFCQFRPCIAK